jgi:hypothetical protein
MEPTHQSEETGQNPEIDPAAEPIRRDGRDQLEDNLRGIVDGRPDRYVCGIQDHGSSLRVGDSGELFDETFVGDDAAHNRLGVADVPGVTGPISISCLVNLHR